MSKYGDQTNCKSLDCLGQLEIGQTGHLLNHPRKMPSVCSSNFYFSVSEFDTLTYVTGCHRLTPQRTECKHFLFDAAGNSL